MSLPEILAQLSTMSPADLTKVRRTVDMLLGGADATPSTWDGHVWSALCKSLKGKGLRLPHYSAIQASPDKRRKLALGAEVIREFLQFATREQDEHRLRVSLPFVMGVVISRMERGNAPMSASVMLNRLPDMPAYVTAAFPGCTASPQQFSMVRALFSQRGSVS